MLRKDGQADDLRHRAGRTIAEMAMPGVAHHLPQLLDGIALGCDGVPQCGGHKAAIHLILTHFKDDFVHAENIAHTKERWQGAISSDCFQGIRFPGDGR